MKKIFFFLFAAGGAYSTFAQTNAVVDTPKPKKSFTADSLLSRWVIDINLLGGVLNQNITAANTAGNYLNGVNMNTNGSLNFSNGVTYGADGQVGFFFGHKRHFGVGTGFMYLAQQGDVTLNSFHAEYQSVDGNQNIFRQSVTSVGAIDEKLQVTNLNIPLLFKYKTRFSKLLGFSADAGLLFNVKESNAYSTNAAFNYEAIYDVVGGKSVYDGAPTPGANDQLYTIATYKPNDVTGTTANYFNTYLPGRGFNTGYDVSPANNKGTVSYTTGTVGFMVRPALDFFLSDNVALNVGVFFIYQNFNNNAEGGYMLTNKAGQYNSLLNTVTSSQNESFGGNVGVRFFIGKKKQAAPPLTIQYIESTNPSVCGACDGTLTLHGLYANQPVVINYMLDGVAQPAHNDVVSAQGTVRISGLCAGAYTGIVASMGADNAVGEPKTLVAPPMGAVSVSSMNTSADGKCDGSLSIHGLRPRQAVTVYYSLNGMSQPAVNANSGVDGTVTLNALCTGSYTHLVAAINGCSATAKDVTVMANAPAGPKDDLFAELHKVSTPILFQTNKTVIQEASRPTLQEAVKLLNEDKTSYIIVDGYTDITGKPAYNKVLSLKRAKAVKKELEDMGIASDRIKIIGHGAKDPVGDNKTVEGRMENRRAVMHLNVGE